MKTKTLYIVIRDCGDGSNSLIYTFEKKEIKKLEKKDADGTIDDAYMSGDGLQVRELKVPVECTYESLGIDYILERDDE